MRFGKQVISGVKNIMPELTLEDLTKAFDEVKQLVLQAKFAKGSLEAAESPEDKKAIELVYNDFLWKIQRRVGQLHFFVCGFEGFPTIANFIEEASQQSPAE